VAWYQTTFKTPEVTSEQRAWLNFGGVAVLSKIWLNGKLLGKHRHAAVPFQFEVTGLLKVNAPNKLTVQIENPNNNTPEDFLVNGFHGLGATTTELGWSGIYRGVELVVTDKACLSDLYVIPEIATGKLECRYEINGPADLKDSHVSVKVSPWSAAGGEIAAQAEAPASPAGRVELQLDSPRLWSDIDPFLYKVEINLVGADGVVRDSLVERVGFRQIRFDGSHILLNEKPVFLRGDMVHFHWPVTVSPTTDRADLRQKLKMYKVYGFNFLRHHTHFPGVEYLEVCDELGLLCSNELGLLMGLMPGVRARNDGSLKWAVQPEDALPMWEALIKRDRNHPAVIIWCMGNESAPEKELMRKMGTLTRKLDNTRLIQSDSPGYYIEEDGSLVAAPVHHELRRAGASYIDTALKPLYDGALRPWRMQFAEQTTAQARLAE
jgi:beta-galactosidase/beta-glucuronidase